MASGDGLRLLRRRSAVLVLACVGRRNRWSGLVFRWLSLRWLSLRWRWWAGFLLALPREVHVQTRVTLGDDFGRCACSDIARDGEGVAPVLVCCPDIRSGIDEERTDGRPISRRCDHQRGEPPLVPPLKVLATRDVQAHSGLRSGCDGNFQQPIGGQKFTRGRWEGVQRLRIAEVDELKPTAPPELIPDSGGEAGRVATNCLTRLWKAPRVAVRKRSAGASG